MGVRPQVTLLVDDVVGHTAVALDMGKQEFK
jgi:hypothetical protein